MDRIALVKAQFAHITSIKARPYPVPTLFFGGVGEGFQCLPLERLCPPSETFYHKKAGILLWLWLIIICNGAKQDITAWVAYNYSFCLMGFMKVKWVEGDSWQSLIKCFLGNIGAVPTEAKSVFQHFATTNKKAHPSPLAMALALEKNVQEPSKVASSGRGQTFDRIHIQ